LPGVLPGRLVPLDIPYKTHLNLLGRSFELAHERGVQGLKDDVGLAAEWVLPQDQESVESDQVVLRAHAGSRTIELRWAEMQRRLLLELVNLPTWAESVKQLLDRNDTGRHPWQSFTEEWKVWA
jgi:hypothetical protein